MISRIAMGHWSPKPPRSIIARGIGHDRYPRQRSASLRGAERRRNLDPASLRPTRLLRRACHRTELSADPWARNDSIGVEHATVVALSPLSGLFRRGGGRLLLAEARRVGAVDQGFRPVARWRERVGRGALQLLRHGAAAGLHRPSSKGSTRA